MILFEYLAIAYGLLLSLSAVRLLNGLSHVLHSARRYWTHAIWACLLLVSALLLFWQHWSTINVQWTFLTFVMNLAGPGMIYFLACTLIPDEARAWIPGATIIFQSGANSSGGSASGRSSWSQIRP